MCRPSADVCGHSADVCGHSADVCSLVFPVYRVGVSGRSDVLCSDAGCVLPLASLSTASCACSVCVCVCACVCARACVCVCVCVCVRARGGACVHQSGIVRKAKGAGRLAHGVHAHVTCAADVAEIPLSFVHEAEAGRERLQSRHVRPAENAQRPGRICGQGILGAHLTVEHRSSTRVAFPLL